MPNCESLLRHGWDLSGYEKVYLGRDQTGLVCWGRARVEFGEGKVGGKGFKVNGEQNRQFLEEERFEERT